MKNLLFIISLLVSGIVVGQNNSNDCFTANPFCSDQSYDFPNATGSNAPSGPNYGCLYSQPNPIWYYMEIAQGGIIEIEIEQTSGPNGSGYGMDVDFAMWGPYPDLATGCAAIMAGAFPLQCSYNPADIEHIGIGTYGGDYDIIPAMPPFIPNDIIMPGDGYSEPPPAQPGEVYIVLLTNFNGGAGFISFNQTNFNNPGAGETDCSIVNPCAIDDFTATVSACDPSTDTYDVTGTITISDAPDNGDLIVVDCNGNQIVVASAPFTSTTYQYTLSGLDADGQGCNVEVSFTADNCSQTINYTAPQCDVPSCFMTYIETTIHPCGSNNDFQITGSVEFDDPPSSGQLIIEDCNGNSVSFNAPFTSPQNFTISGIDADGAPCDVTAYFTADPSCTISLPHTNTADCDCAAFIGTFTATNAVANDVTSICFGDGFSIISNGDYIPPSEINNPPFVQGYDPGLGWLIYSCPPTVALTPDPINDIPDDPCLLGFIGSDDISDINDLTFLDQFPPGIITDNTVYLVPITMYHVGAGYYSYVVTDMPCYQTGNVYGIQYLPEITETTVEDCQAGTVSTTIQGGAAELNGTDFTASNLTPSTATFDVDVVGNGGTIIVSGLVDGDTYSFDIEDESGCVVTISGIFQGATSSDFTYPEDGYCTNETNPVPTVTGDQGGVFSSSPGIALDASTGLIDLSASTPGNYTITYTSPGAPCNSSSTFEITIADVPVFTITYTSPTCGNNDGEIVISGLNASTSYNLYYEQNGTPVGPNSETTDFNGDIILSNLPEGVYSSFEVSAGGGCSTSDPGNYHLNASDAPQVTAPDDIDICIGESVTLTADNPDGGTLSWDNGVTDGVSFTPSSPGITTYTVSSTIDGCTATDEVTVTVHDLPNVNAGPDQAVCEGTSITLNATGATYYSWSNNLNNGDSFIPTSTDTYVVVGTDIHGCENTDDFTVEVHPYPVPSFVGDELFGCQPHTVNFVNNTGYGSGTTCLWEFGDGTTSTDCNGVSHTYTSSGVYSVTLTVTNSIGCSESITMTNYIEVVPKPIAAFNADPMVVPMLEPDIEFTNESENATDYVWNFGDGSPVVTTYNAMHSYSDGAGGNYVVTLVASNGMVECNDTAMVIITVEEDLIFYVPNTFTPDADNFNEVFQPVFSSGFEPLSYTLLIYNRWGELLFESHDVNAGWDGTYGIGRNGIVQDGIYIWKIRFKETGKDKHNEYVGHVNLLR